MCTTCNSVSIDVSMPELRGTDDVLFQFKGKGKGWRHAELVGTVTPHQAWLALKKLARDDFDVTKVMPDMPQSLCCIPALPPR